MFSWKHFRSGGEENERQMANNIMQEMRFYDNPIILEECQLYMHVAHEDKILCDSYIVEFDYDPTCNYYEREIAIVSFFFLAYASFCLFS